MEMEMFMELKSHQRNKKNFRPDWKCRSIWAVSALIVVQDNVEHYVYSMEVHGNYLYAVSYYGHSVFRIHTTTGVCDYSERVRYAYNLAIGDNKLHAFGRYGNRTTWNLSGSTPSKIACSGGVYNWMRYTFGTAVDPSGKYWYSAYYNNLYRHTIDNNGCVSTSYASQRLK